MEQITTAEILAQIDREREELQQILASRKYKPLAALDEFYKRNGRLREAAAGTDPETFGLGVAEIRVWFEQATQTLLRSADVKRRIEELSREAEMVDPTFDPAHLDEAAAKIERMERLKAEAISLKETLIKLQSENEHVRKSVDHLKQIGDELDTLFEHAGASRAVVRRAKLRQLWLRSLFIVAAFAGALLVGKVADFAYENLLRRPLPSLAYLVTSLLAFALETVFVGRALEASQEELHWKLYEDLLAGLDNDLAQIGEALSQLRQLVNIPSSHERSFS